MKKNILILVFIIISCKFLNATRQTPDILLFNNEKLSLDTGWGHPSPLETYYKQNSIKYPFEMISTGNYRGFVATWKIENSRFYLVNVDVDGKKHKPKDFNIKSENIGFSSENKLFADWFTGVIISKKINKKTWEIEYSIYQYIRKGIVEKEVKIMPKDFEKLEKFTEKDTVNTDLVNKYSMLYLNQSYISYYFRLHDKETIEINSKKGYITDNKGNNLVLKNYKNTHFDWPYNWENTEQNGVPNGVWTIENNKLLLKTLNLHTGLSFEGPEKVKLELKQVFKDKKFEQNKVFADWISGVYLIKYGKNVKDEYDFETFKTSSIDVIKVKEGIILEKHPIPMKEDISEEDIAPNIKKLIEEYKNQ